MSGEPYVRKRGSRWPTRMTVHNRADDPTALSTRPFDRKRLNGINAKSVMAELHVVRWKKLDRRPALIISHRAEEPASFVRQSAHKVREGLSHHVYGKNQGLPGDQIAVDVRH